MLRERLSPRTVGPLELIYEVAQVGYDSLLAGENLGNEAKLTFQCKLKRWLKRAWPKIRVYWLGRR